MSLLTRRLGRGPGEQLLAPARPGRTVVITQARIDQLSRWNVASALAAIDDHEIGDFIRSAHLIESMGRDDKISSSINTRVRAIVGVNGLDFSIEPPEGQAKTLAERVGKWWFDFLPDATLTRISADSIMGGLSVSRLHWGIVDRELRPLRAEPWHLSHIRYDPQIERLVARTTDDEIVIEPDDPNWLVIEPGGARSWMCGAVRALGLAYVMRSFNWRDWGRFNERHGMPVIAITEPPGIDEKKKREFYESVRKMGSTGMVRLPQGGNGVGFGIEFKEAKDTAHASFEAFRKNIDIAISVCLLGQNLTSEATGGSLALGRVQDRVRQDYLEADTEGLSTALRAQVLMRWGRYNVAGFTDDQAPWPTWDCSAPVDRQAEAETLGKVADAVKVFQSTNMPVDYGEVFARVGIPMRKGEDPNTVEAPVQPPPGAIVATPAAKEKPPAKKLASGGNLAGASGFVQGQLYVDDLVDGGVEKAQKAGRAFLLEILKGVQEGRSYEEIRAAVLKRYGNARPPKQVREILAQTLILAELAGETAVLEDAPEAG